MEDYQKIHDLQRNHMNNEIYNKERKTFHESWFKDDTVDFWRHKRMYKTIEPIASFYKDKKWVSIGDGRYGLDSYRLNKLFNLDVFPTDISKNMLEKAIELGIIKKYGVENAEKLSFQDNSFDISFCKESFHHFPRPIIALYEMIRISKTAVILLEPNDGITLHRPKAILAQLVKIMLSNIFPKNNIFKKKLSFFHIGNNSFEESGNYIYAVSRRELEKIVLGANLKGLAWKGYNDFYVKGCEFERADPNNSVFRTINGKINKRDIACKRLPLFFDWDLITVVIFKKEIDNTLKIEMESSGFEFLNITHNPHIGQQ